MKLKCIVYSISEQRIVNYNFLVETENLPLQGLDPDLKIYGEYYTNQEPPFDSRTQTMALISTMIDEEHPLYPSLLTYRKSYDLVRKSNTELFLAIDLMEAWANDQLSPATNRAAKQQRYSKILHKKVKELPLEQWEEDLLDLMDEVADAMDTNADRADQLKDFVEANPDLIPDLDSGWITELN